MNKYKTIVPGLVTFETDLNSLHGFVMCQDFDFFESSKNKAPFHYKLEIVDNIELPSNYDFRSEYYLKQGNHWYYDRSIAFFRPYFRYDFVNKIFSFNRLYLNLPVKIGGIFTLGEHLCNLIDLDLFLSNHLILRGIGFNQNGNNLGVSAPGFNGKTTLLNRLVENGCGYLAEDYLIIDMNNFAIYPTCPLVNKSIWRNRSVNNNLLQYLKEIRGIKHSVSLEKLYLIENTLNIESSSRKKSFIDYILLNSLYFIDNLFVKSIIFDQQLTEKIMEKIDKYKNTKMNIQYIKVKNFKFPF